VENLDLRDRISEETAQNCIKKRILVVQDKIPDGVAFESSTECNCIMSMIHLVQDKGPVEVTSEYSNE